MGERNAKKWRVEQRWEEPDILIPEGVFEERAKARQRREAEFMKQAIDELSYRPSDGRTYTRNPQTSRDGKESIRGENARRKSRYAKRRLIAGTLAAIAILGVVHHEVRDDTPSQASTALVQEAGVGANTLGLTPELVEKLKEYEAFFDQYNPDELISEEDVLAKINEISELKNEVLSAKLGALFNVPADKVENGRVTYDSDAQLYCTIRVGDDIVLSNSLLPIFKRKDISKDIQNLLVLFDEIDSLSGKVRNDKITKDKAISRLGEKYFEPLEIIANSEFIRDKHDNVIVVYEKINETNKEAEQEEKGSGKQAEGKEKEDEGMEIGD